MGNVMRGVRNLGKAGAVSPPEDTEEDVLVVLQDYPSIGVSEPTYRLGEKLRLIAQDDYCWRVQSVQTGKESYIPGSQVARVYHGWLFEGVERQKAEELLQLPANRSGSFMVRESSRERGLYSLSVKQHRSVKHYRIYRLDNSWYYISPRLTFQCLEDLINHYSDFADGLCCALTSPCLSSSAPPPAAAAASTGPPVAMRCNFDWKTVDSQELLNTDGCGDNMLSYGVRNSIAAYLSFSEAQPEPSPRSLGRMRKTKSMYDQLAIADYEGNL